MAQSVTLSFLNLSVLWSAVSEGTSYTRADCPGRHFEGGGGQPELLHWYFNLLSIRDEETSFQNVEGKETCNISSLKEEAECESDKGQSHPSML